MAGSRKWFNYTSDDGTTYALNGDESNIEAVNGSTLGWTTGNAKLPKGYSPRFAAYSNTEGTRTIKVPVLTAAKYATLLTDGGNLTDPYGDGTAQLNLAYLTPEFIRRRPRTADTGLNDGDNP